jgi:hypothetical protein
MNSNPRCDRCRGETFGRDAHCFPCGRDVRDYGPYAGEDARDRREAAKIDREAEEDDSYVQLGFRAVSTFSEGEMATWTAAHR